MKRVIISGYFNPLHGGHLDMIETAARMGEYLIVIVNNDVQAVLKKGKVILDENNRMRLMRSLRAIDEAILSVDRDLTQVETLKMVAEKYHDDELLFANGGDRDSKKAIPESDVCQEYNIEMRFDAGVGKPDSSTRINQALGHES